MSGELFKSPIRRALKWVLWISLALGAMVGGFALYAGLQHNPQYEFYGPEPGTFDLVYALSIFLSWLIPVAVLSFLCLAFALGLVIAAQRLWHGTTASLARGVTEE